MDYYFRKYSDLKDTKTFSGHLSTVLDKIGYSPHIIKHRRDFYATTDYNWNQTHERLIRVTAGSKSEGFSGYCESDTDFLYICKYIACTIPNKRTVIADMDKVTIFEMLSDQCAHGHYKLKRMKRGSYPLTRSVAKALLTLSNGDSYISSDLFRKSLVKHLSTHVEGGCFSNICSGPAVTRTFRGRKHDYVYGFRCNCQETILSEWISRPREYNWPSSKLVQEVTKLEAQLVPVCSKVSECRNLEWRICFIPGEMKLTQSLNETQYKVYILLKLINKSILQPICSELSSYIMKHIVYWLVEKHPTEMFIIDNLFDMLMIALSMLQQAVKDNYCQYFMLPERNLLRGRLSAIDIVKLTDILDTLKNEGPQLILRCDKLKGAWEMPILELEIKGTQKDEAEKAVLELRKFKITFRFMPNMSWQEKDKQLCETEEYINHVIKLRDLAWPDWREHFKSNEDAKKKTKIKLEQLLL